jgi:sulfur relay (sulfurtransferase) DsrC/TusE family protein
MKKNLQQQEALNQMLNDFAANTFLIPPTWTEKQHFSGRSSSYRTYCDDERRYMGFEEWEEGATINWFTAFKKEDGWRISVTFDLYQTQRTLKQVEDDIFNFIKELWNEKHCLNPNKIIIKEIRKKMGEIKTRIAKDKQEVAKLELRLKHSRNKPSINLT